MKVMRQKIFSWSWTTWCGLSSKATAFARRGWEGLSRALENLEWRPGLRKLCSLVDRKVWNEKLLMETLIQTSQALQSMWAFFGISGAALGVVLALHANQVLADFRADDKLPLFVALPLLREFGPTLSAMFFASIAGSAMVAETGLMQATDQLLSMELMGVRPLSWVFLPRFLSAMVACPLLMLICIGSGILGSVGCMVWGLGLDGSLLMQTLSQEVDWRGELRVALMKNSLFAAVVAGCSLSFGYTSPRHTEGVARATIRGVTWSLLGVLLADVLMEVGILQH